MSIHDTECKVKTPLITKGRSGFICSGLPAEQIKALTANPAILNGSLRDILDSLGYFSQHWDTLTSDSFRIKPGRRAVVKSVGIGTDTFLLSEIREYIKTPCFYDAGLVTKWMREIARIYSAHGYPFCKISIRLQDAGSDFFHIFFSVERDDFCRFGAPLFKGTGSMPSKILYHDLSFGQNDTFDIRKVERTCASLRKRPYIETVEAGELFLDRTAIPDSDGVSNVMVPLIIEERKGLGIDGAVGMQAGNGEGSQVRGKGMVSLINLFHRGEQASLEYTGEKAYQKLQCELTVPWLFNWPVITALAGGLEIREQEYGYLYGRYRTMIALNDRWQVGGELRVNESSDSTRYIFYGAQALLSLPSEPLQVGMWSQEMNLFIGSGIARRECLYTRSNIDFMTGIQFPITRRFAVHCRIAAMNCVTDEKELVPAEMYRVGGHGTMRGYSDEEYAFRSVFMGQSEYLFYFNRYGSAYIFLDGGAGFTHAISIDTEDRRDLLGYGIGVRLPVSFGILMLEWARNREDRRSYGRIHVQFTNNLKRNASG